MSNGPLSTYQDFLFELRAPVRTYFGTSVLMMELELHLAQKKAEDDAYLASLTDVERRRVLLQRRIERVERRYRAWWEANMAWRFRADPPVCEEYDW